MSFRIREIIKYPTDNYSLTDTENRELITFCCIISIITIILSLFSIILLMMIQASFSIKHKIKVIFCILILFDQLTSFFNYFTNNLLIILLRSIISFCFPIIFSYWSMIYSYIPYQLFGTPKTLESALNKFFIDKFGWILLIIISLYVFLIPKIAVFFQIESIPLSLDGLIITNVLFIIFCFISIRSTKKLLRGIKRTIILATNSEIEFINKKEKSFKKHLCLSLVCYIIIYIRILAFYFLDNLVNEKQSLFNHRFEIFFITLGIKYFSGLVCWFTFVFNKNLFYRLKIALRKESNDEYRDELEEEKKMYEASEAEMLVVSNSRNNSLLLEVNMGNIINDASMIGAIDIGV